MMEPARAWLAVLALAVAPGCRIEENVGQAFKGPACDCAASFPICVGAEWTYWVVGVVDQRSGRGAEKTLTITDWADPGHDRHQMTGFLAFRQRRVTASDAKDSWLVHTPDGHSLLWLMDDWFDAVGRRTRTRYYVPGKLRIDETPERPVPGATWSEHYTEYRIEWADGGAETALEHDVAWQTLGPEEHGELTGSLCQHKLDVTRDASGSVVESEATYCFVPGVGKVYELTPLVEEEDLIDRSLPGCE